MRTVTALVYGCLLALGAPACSKSEPKKQAPEVSALRSAAPATVNAEVFTLDTKNSGVEFTMDAELEQISGRAPASAEGALFVDLKDLSKSTGLVKIDLDKLSIYKKTRAEAGAEFGAEEKSDKQNRDMRNWLQIGDDAPDGDRSKYRWAEFKITSLKATPNDVTSLTGATRKVAAQVSGDFRLHGRMTQRTLAAELTFTYAGNRPTGVTLKTTTPFDVGLEEHDIRPRKSFAELADTTLEALGQKVSKVAKVSIEAHAFPK